MNIRLSSDHDRKAILQIHRDTFDASEAEEIADLVDHMLDDKTARPCFSFVALAQDTIVGHILFSNVTIGNTAPGIRAQILAPLAVLPDYQNKGIGTALIKHGLEHLKASDIDLVFVLGHPGYYPRCGFKPAGTPGFEATYPVPDEHADAWMVQALHEGVIGKVKGKIHCCDALDQPKYWCE